MKIISYFLFIIQVLLLVSCNSTSNKKVLTEEMIAKEQIRRSKIKSRTELKYSSVDYMKSPLKTVCIFDSLGNNIQETSYDSNGNINFRAELKYDKNGNEVKGVQYNNGSVICKYVTKYDSEGRIILDDQIRENNYSGTIERQILRTTYKYDDLGRKVESFYTSEVGVPEAHTVKNTYKYGNKNNEEIECVKIEDNLSKYKTINFFTNDGKLEKSDEYVFLKDSILI